MVNLNCSCSRKAATASALPPALAATAAATPAATAPLAPRALAFPPGAWGGATVALALLGAFLY